jgi:AspT/YidE/YbjL antiporter-like protein
MNIFSGVILVQGISFVMFSSFACIFIGLLIGRITIKGVSLGSAGVFIIALIYGALFSNHLSSTVSQKVSNELTVDISTNALKIVENLGLIFFIGSVGFISGPTFFSNLKKNFKSYIISGIFVILISTLTCVCCFYIGKKSAKDPEEFNAMIVGIFSGALTSTPAFSAAKATANTKYESAVTVGHGIAYLFGVIGVVLFVQIIPKIVGANMDIERALIGGEGYEKRIGTERTENPDLHNKNIEQKKGEKNKKKNVDTKNEVEKRIEFDPKRITTEHIESTRRPQMQKEGINENMNENENENENENKKNENDEKVSEQEEENKNEEDNNNKEEENKENNLFKLDKYGLCIFGFGAIFGIFIGAIRIPLSKKLLDGTTFSLTTTGGVLITTLILGHYGKICCLSLKIDKSVLEIFRELGLLLFLLGTGIAGGAKFIDYFKAVYFLYGIAMTLMPLILGFIFCKYVLRLCLLNNLGSLTGGMTSTPALGTLISVAQTDQVGGAYAATYPISLISVVLASQFMVLLMK